MQFVGTMPAMIEAAGLLSALLGSWVDFWIIFALLMTNATLGFVEEMNAQASISALKDGMIRKLPVKRDGKFTPLNGACQFGSERSTRMRVSARPCLHAGRVGCHP